MTGLLTEASKMFSVIEHEQEFWNWFVRTCNVGMGIYNLPQTTVHN